MQTKHIEKLEELKGYEWEYNGKHFEIAYLKLYVQPAQPEINGLNLIQTDSINFHGDIQAETIRRIGEKNLTELEFYGLKVVLNEKPKLRRKERDFLEMLEDNQTYIARGDNPWGLRLFGFEPTQYDSEWLFIDGENEDGGICLKYELFPFITWESGKAWSKAELMELEVVD